MEDRGSGSPIALAICTALVVGALVGGAIGCGGGGDDPTTTETSTSAAPATTPAPAKVSDCKRVEPPKVKPVSYRAPARVVKKGEALTAVVKTSCGTFEIALKAKWSQAAVNSFVFLSEKGFYDGLGFERAAYDTYVEGGKPPDAAGPGYGVTGEIPEGFIYRHGVVAMSQPGEGPPGHAGSRFFIVVAAPWLDFSGLYAPVGRVNRGFGVLEDISELGPPDPYAGTGNIGSVGQIGKLRRPVVIEGITIERG